MNCSVYAAFMIWKGTDETMVDIQCKDGKYIIDARIHSEVDTNDIAKVQERFTSDCAYEFAEAMIGFSTYTCLPCAIASIVIGKWE